MPSQAAEAGNASQHLVPPAQALDPQVKDNAGFFRPDTIQAANQILHDIERWDHRDVVVETYAHVPAGHENEVKKPGAARDRCFSQWATSRAEQMGLNGILILICKNPGYLEIVLGNKTRCIFTNSHRDSLKSMMLEAFKAKRYDSGLLDGLHYIQKILKDNPQAIGRGSSLPGLADHHPALVVCIRSLNDLLEDFKYLAKLGDMQGEADRECIEVRKLCSDQGQEGIDLRKPIGFYVNVPEDPPLKPVLMIPVTDLKPVLNNMERCNLKVEMRPDGIYEFTFPGDPHRIYFRLANAYAYVTVDFTSPLDGGELANPAKLFAPEQSSTASVVIRIDRLPQRLTRRFLGQLKYIDPDDDHWSGLETAAQKYGAVATEKAIVDGIATLIKEASKLDATINVDRAANQLVAQATLSATDRSALERDLAALGRSESLFSSWRDTSDALDVVIHVTLPASLREPYAAVIDEVLRGRVEEEKAPTQRSNIDKLRRAAANWLKAGELDIGLRMIGPDKDSLYTVVAGIKLREGKKIAEAVEQIWSQLPARERNKITLNARRLSNVNVHRLGGERELNREAVRILGQNPVYAAIADHGAFLGAGPDALKMLAVALESKPAIGPLFELDMSMSKLGPFLASHPESQTAAKIEKAIADLIKGRPKSDRVKVAISAGDGLGIRLSMDAAAARFIIHRPVYHPNGQ
jgi:hypothetical protein